MQTQQCYQTNENRFSYQKTSTQIININDIKKPPQKLTPIVDQEYLSNPKQIRQKVQPLLKEDIQRFKNYFFTKPQRFKANTLRDYTWFVFAYHTGRRASDFTKVRVCDIMDEEGNIRDYWHIDKGEQKTGKKTVIPLDQYAKDALIQYFTYKQNNNMPYKMSDYCFVNYTSKKKRSDVKHNADNEHNVTSNPDIPTPLTTENIRTIMKRAAKDIGIQYNVGSHTMRKTTGAVVSSCSDDPNIEDLLCEFYAHSSKETTRIYMEKNLSQKKNTVEQWGKYLEE